MSTYLLAFAVTDFVRNINTIQNFSVYAQPDKFHLTNYALDFGIRARQIIENYVQRTYQLPKMDLMGFDDFLFSAMENWGLITFKSSSLLYNTVNQNDLSVLQSLSQTITHEIIHMWFGNEGKYKILFIILFPIMFHSALLIKLHANGSRQFG